MIKRFLPQSAYNPISIAGAALAIVSFATILFLTIIEIVQKNSPPYIGIVSYVILPVPMLLGLALIPIGMWRERQRRARGKPASRLSFTVDLNIPRHRSALTLFATVVLILSLFTAYGSYRTFEWTESVEFCGETCHQVMEPEFAAYQNSPHARVACVACHVGSGADWYVRSKLSGAYQVYSVALKKYSRPIPTPIHDLRPAQETCEQCHWPSHFAGEKKYVNTYFKADEQNTQWTIALLMKTGGGKADRSPTNGIHWHMNIANEITYVATDPRRQTIPWVKMSNKATGEETEFLSTESTQSAGELKSLETHTMDCIDCHNRPSHVFLPPARIIDQSLAQGRISTSLPSIKEAAIQALVQPYSTGNAAADSIPLILKGFYQERYPDVLTEKADLLEQATREIKTQFSRNMFPFMKVDWRAYPNNIGHMNDLGCFRCHDGKHVSADGKVISNDCNSCHTILYQGKEAAPSSLALAGLPFEHPEDIGELWRETPCKDCHSGQ